MDLEQGFLGDMVGHPNDAGLWLIFADWLEERGDVRGELVRLARLLWDEPGHSDFAARRARAENLLAAGVRLPLPRSTNTLGMEFVWVPPGRFWRGGENGHVEDASLSVATPFWIGLHTATQGQWQTLLGDNRSCFSRAGAEARVVADFPDAELARFPVEEASWHDARQFVEALNAREPAGEWAYRLPTEQEWEYACRWPVFDRDGCAHSYYFEQPTNSVRPDQANFMGCRHRPMPVGSYPANRLGLFEMHGNVWEWTQSGNEAQRVIRGGSWGSVAGMITAASRLPYGVGQRNRHVGFRLVRVRAEARP